MKLNCIVVDDSKTAIAAIEYFIEKASDLNLVASFTDPFEAIEFLKQNEIDLMFLDLEMPGLGGYDLLKVLKEPIPQVVITSSHAELAVDSYNFDVTDYLLKPFTFPRFMEALQRVLGKFKPLQPDTAGEHLYIRKGPSIVKVDPEEILLLESTGDYITIHTEHERFMVLSSLSSVEKRLSADDFVRVHRSFIVRFDKVKSIEDSCVVCANRLIPIGKTYKDAVYKRLNIL